MNEQVFVDLCNQQSLIEQACNSLVSGNETEKSNAEAFINQFRKISINDPLLWHIIEKSNHEVATFEAAIAIRNNISKISLDQSTNQNMNIIPKLLDIIFSRFTVGDILPENVQQILYNCIAIILKKLWSQGSESRSNHLNYIYNLGINDKQKKLEGIMEYRQWTMIQILTNIIQIFSEISSPSFIGVMQDFHRDCHELLFSEGHLQHILELGILSTRVVLSNFITSNAFHHKILNSSINLIVDILQFNFIACKKWKNVKGNINRLQNSNLEDISLNENQLQPPISWFPLLYNDILEILFFLSLRINEKSNLLDKVIECLSLLSKFHFSNEIIDNSNNENLESLFIEKFMQGMIQILDSNLAFIDSSFILQQLLEHFRFDKIGKCPSALKFLQKFGKLSEIKFCDENGTEEELCSFLISWRLIFYCDLVEQSDDLKNLLGNFSVELFANFIRNYVNRNSQEDSSYFDPEVEETILESISLIGRFSIYKNSIILFSILSEKLSNLNQSTNLCDISFLIRIITRFLADNPKGETPVIPGPLKAFSKQIKMDQDDPCCFLSNQIFSITKIYCEGLKNNSPIQLLCLTFPLIEFYSFWSFSYLFCNEKSYENNDFASQRLFNQFGHKNGIILLDSILYFCNESLLYYLKKNNEENLKYFFTFLVQLSCSSFICSHVHETSSFEPLLSLFIHDQRSPPPTLLHLSNNFIRKFSRSILSFSSYYPKFNSNKIMEMISNQYSCLLNSSQEITSEKLKFFNFYIQVLCGSSKVNGMISECLLFLDSLVTILSVNLLDGTINLLKKFITVQFDCLEDDEQTKVCEISHKIFLRIFSMQYQNEEQFIDYLVIINKILVVFLESISFLPKEFEEMLISSFQILFTIFDKDMELLRYPELNEIFFCNLKLLAFQEFIFFSDIFCKIIFFLFASVHFDSYDCITFSFDGLREIIEFFIKNPNHSGCRKQISNSPSLLSDILNKLLNLIIYQTLPPSSISFISKSIYFIIIKFPQSYSENVKGILQNIDDIQQREKLASYFNQLSSEIDVNNPTYPNNSVFQSFNGKVLQFICLCKSMNASNTIN